MNKFLLFLYTNKNENKRQIKIGVKLVIHLIIMLIFSFIYFGCEIKNYNDKKKEKSNNNDKQSKLQELKKKYNTDFFSYLFFSCVVHTTTGFDNDYPNNKYIKYTIFVHMIVVFVLLFIL
jgi:branched-subunit amino acid permease